MTRKVHLTGQIKPSTRNAMLDQLAAIADGIIRERETLQLAQRLLARRLEREMDEAFYGKPVARRWWHRLARWFA